MSTPLRLTALLTLVTLLCFGMDWRIQRAGEWLPQFPEQFGQWGSKDAPLGEGELAALGNPKNLSRTYTNPFGETVQVTILTASSVLAFHDPRFCSVGSGYAITGNAKLPIAGPGTDVTAMALENHGQHALLLYWCQTGDGDVYTGGAMSGSFAERYLTRQYRFRSVVAARPLCIVHLSAPVMVDDPMGQQAKRNLMEFAQTIYHSLRSAR